MGSIEHRSFMRELDNMGKERENLLIPQTLTVAECYIQCQFASPLISVLYTQIYSSSFCGILYIYGFHS